MLIWLLSDRDSAKHLAFRESLLVFLSHYPDLQADFEVKTRTGLWESLFAHLRDPKRNRLADLIEIPHNWTALLAKLGLISDLGRVLDDFDPLACPGFITAECKPSDSGAVFSAPWWMDAPALFCDEGALGRLPAGASEGLSWDDFVSALDKTGQARASRGPKPPPLCFPGSGGSLELSSVLPRIWSRGGGLFSEDLNRAAFNKAETVAGINDFAELGARGLFRFFPAAPFSGEGHWPAGSMAISPRDLCSMPHRGQPRPGKTVMLPFPGYRLSPGGVCGPVNISSLAIASGAASVKEPAAFLKWLLKPERALSFASSFLAFPCGRTAYEDRLERSKCGGLYSRIFEGASLRPNIAVYPTAELLLERILWNISLAAARGDYSQEQLSRELIIAQGEADYLLSLY